MKFKDKLIKCDEDELQKKSNEALEAWITALLKRMRVDANKIDSILNDPKYTKRSWRVELFYNHGIEIVNHGGRVVITKHSSESDDIVLGEWKPPSIVRIKEGKDRYCELHLNYWQIV